VNVKNLIATEPPLPVASTRPSHVSKSIKNPRALAPATASPPTVLSRLLLSLTPEEPSLSILTITIVGPSHVKPHRAPRLALILTLTPTNMISNRLSS
jgi:hypothetical protein